MILPDLVTQYEKLPNDARRAILDELVASRDEFGVLLALQLWTRGCEEARRWLYSGSRKITGNILIRQMESADLQDALAPWFRHLQDTTAPSDT
jgi:hypothetical protein